MYRLAFRPTLKAVLIQPRPVCRTFLSSPLRTAHSPDKPLSQGHATSKSQETLHKDADIQSASVRAGRDAKADASKNPSGDDAPLDAARQGGADGSAKETADASQEKVHGDRGKAGSFQDQVGGQDQPDKGPGVLGGGKEQASRGSIGDSIKQSLGFGDANKSRKVSRRSRSC